jgi:hypothetical protein
MSATLEEVVEEVEALPPEQQVTILEAFALIFGALILSGEATNIIEKALSLSPDDRDRLLDKFSRGSDRRRSRVEARRNLTRSVRGKYANLPTSSEAFASRKAEEIALEDRRSEQ